jgi:hypothetical protein
MSLENFLAVPSTHDGKSFQVQEPGSNRRPKPVNEGSWEEWR